MRLSILFPCLPPSCQSLSRDFREFIRLGMADGYPNNDAHPEWLAFVERNRLRRFRGLANRAPPRFSAYVAC